jgi:hypothetical protein
MRRSRKGNLTTVEFRDHDGAYRAREARKSEPRVTKINILKKLIKETVRGNNS